MRPHEKATRLSDHGSIPRKAEGEHAIADPIRATIRLGLTAERCLSFRLSFRLFRLSAHGVAVHVRRLRQLAALASGGRDRQGVIACCDSSASRPAWSSGPWRAPRPAYATIEEATPNIPWAATALKTGSTARSPNNSRHAEWLFGTSLEKGGSTPHLGSDADGLRHPPFTTRSGCTCGRPTPRACSPPPADPRRLH
jgi:hypothetical protein